MSTEAVFNKFKIADALAMASQNLIINNNMDISQENGGVVSNTNGYYPADQWPVTMFGGQNVNTYQSALGPDNIDKSLALIVKVANAAPNTSSLIYTEQPIEGTFTKKLAWGTSAALPVTYGFWTWSDQTMTFCSSLRNAVVDRSYINEHTINESGVWKWYTGVVPGPTDGTWNTNTSASIYFNVCVESGTNYHNTASSWHSDNAVGTSGITNFGAFGAGNTFLVTGAILLPGAHNISAEQSVYLQRPYDDELRKCQRYYEPLIDGREHTQAMHRHQGWNITNKEIWCPTLFSAQKRTQAYTLEYSGNFRVVTANSTPAWDTEPVNVMTITTKTAMGCRLQANTTTTVLGTGYGGEITANNDATALAAIDDRL